MEQGDCIMTMLFSAVRSATVHSHQKRHKEQSRTAHYRIFCRAAP